MDALSTAIFRKLRSTHSMYTGDAELKSLAEQLANTRAFVINQHGILIMAGPDESIARARELGGSARQLVDAYAMLTDATPQPDPDPLERVNAKLRRLGFAGGFDDAWAQGETGYEPDPPKDAA